MGNVSAFFTAYSAKRGDADVEAIAVIVDGAGSTASVSFVVVDHEGRASIAPSDEIDLYDAHDSEGDEG